MTRHLPHDEPEAEPGAPTYPCCRCCCTDDPFLTERIFTPAPCTARDRHPTPCILCGQRSRAL